MPAAQPASTPAQVYGRLRDGHRKELTLYEGSLSFWWADGLLPALSRPRRGPAMPWGYECTYPRVRRAWVRRRRLYVETDTCTHWLRFRRRDAAEAERCRRFIAARLAPADEIAVSRSQLETCPHDYHGRRIRVTAWVRRAFEASYLIWDAAEYTAHPLDPRGRKLAYTYRLRSHGGDLLESGRHVRPMPNLAFMRVWVAVHAVGEFLDAAGDAARRQARIEPPRRGWLGRLLERVSDWLDARLTCHAHHPDPDEGISLRAIEGVFGPMTLHGVFESRPGHGNRAVESWLTVYHVTRPAEPPPADAPGAGWPTFQPEP